MAAVSTIGVVADTHVPDRVGNLHPGLATALRKAKVDLILHAGDISTPGVLEELRKIAPVIAARGNRDWAVKGLQWVVPLTIHGCPVSLMHGHGSWARYFQDKIKYLRDGYRLERYLPDLVRLSGEARIVVFGHTHISVNLWYNEKLLFNPGTAGLALKGRPPSFGIIRIFENQLFEGEIISLRGAKVINKSWTSDES